MGYVRKYLTISFKIKFLLTVLTLISPRIKIIITQAEIF